MANNTSNRFPECVYLGEFTSAEYGKVPAYLPANKGGFCIHYNDKNSKLVNQQVENTVLCLFEDTPINLLNVHIFDFANRPNFPFLNKLKDHGACKVSLNENATLKAFNSLERLSQYRYHNLFDSSEKHIDQYNARSPRPEAYQVLIINTAYFPNNNISAQRMHNFLATAHGAGIYVIVLHNPALFDEYHSNAALETLVSFLPSVHISLSKIVVAEDILPIKHLEDFDFAFTPANLDKDKLVAELKQHLQGDSSHNESDFLTVRIGTRPNGESAQLSLGQASMNYHALLLGISGSGKSTLMNNVIMQIGENYDANEIRLYLMDYKQGVEFNKFKNHPNVEKVFLASDDIAAGIALLEQVKADIKQRYQLFKRQGLEDIDSYNHANKKLPLPHIILMIDEFHKLLQGDFRHNEYVNTLLEDVAKLGRASGVHLWLSTQSLKDVNFMSSVKDQIGLRMTYRVVSESALGYDIFAAQNSKEILSLDKYQVLLQVSQTHAYTAFVDRPLEIEDTISKLRLTRPKHLQVQAQVIESKQTTETATTMPTPAQQQANTITAAQQAPVINSSSTNNRCSVDSGSQSYKKEQVVNPNIAKFAQLDIMIAELENKLSATNTAADNDVLEIPDWLKDDG